MDFYISAAHKSSGKTTLGIGLGRALLENGLKVQAFKKGPDYIDPLWLTQASTNPCYNLDFYTDTDSKIRQLFNSRPADIRLVEGNKGLYDGLNLDGSDSNAAMAALVDIPVILVIDCEGITRGIAPLLNGYQAFQSPAADFAGVILNKVGGSRHETKLIKALEQYTDFKLLGALAKDKTLTIEQRHLGLVPANENSEAERLISRLAAAVKNSIDLHNWGLSKISQKDKSEVQTERKIHSKPNYAALRLGISRDEAFGFYYQSDLDRLEALGVKIKYFSILHDEKLPAVDGVFLGGGFPETHMHKIAKNKKILIELANKIEQGLPVYAECGGMMILTEKIIWNDEVASMAGVIKADCVMSARPYGRGYVKLKAKSNHPWQVQNCEIRAHEFHYSTLKNFKKQYEYAYDVIRGSGIKQQQDGLIYKNLLANYTHFKHTEQNPWLDDFLKLCFGCLEYKMKRK